MIKVSSWIAAAAVCGTAMFGATNANAAMVYNIVGSFSGGQLGTVSFDVTISAEFSANINDTTTGLQIHTLTRNNLPFMPDGGLAYNYEASFDILGLGGLYGGVTGIMGGGNGDFRLGIALNDEVWVSGGSPILDFAGGTGFLGSPDPGPLQVTAVPLPAAFYLFGTAIAGLLGVGWRRRIAST